MPIEKKNLMLRWNVWPNEMIYAMVRWIGITRWMVFSDEWYMLCIDVTQTYFKKITHQIHMKHIKLSKPQEDKGDYKDHTNISI